MVAKAKDKPKRKKKSKEVIELLEPGTLVCRGVLHGRAVPWKAPGMSRHGGIIPTKSYKTFRAWKDTIAEHAKQRMAGRKPYAGPVGLNVVFFLNKFGPEPDRSNLLKAFEDALQCVVFINDRQIVTGYTEKVFSAEVQNSVHWTVEAADMVYQEDH